MSKATAKPGTTLRERLRAALLEGGTTVRDLSGTLGVTEKDAPDHLAHLARPLAHHGERLAVTPASCISCDSSSASGRSSPGPARAPLAAAPASTLRSSASSGSSGYSNW